MTKQTPSPRIELKYLLAFPGHKGLIPPMAGIQDIYIVSLASVWTFWFPMASNRFPTECTSSGLPCIFLAEDNSRLPVVFSFARFGPFCAVNARGPNDPRVTHSGHWWWWGGGRWRRTFSLGIYLSIFNTELNTTTRKKYVYFTSCSQNPNFFVALIFFPAENCGWFATCKNDYRRRQSI